MVTKGPIDPSQIQGTKLHWVASSKVEAYLSLRNSNGIPQDYLCTDGSVVLQYEVDGVGHFSISNATYIFSTCLSYVSESLNAKAFMRQLLGIGNVVEKEPVTRISGGVGH